MEPSDSALVEAALRGDPDAFAMLLARHYDRIYRLAWRVLGSVAEAEDLAQDVCATLPGKLKGFRGQARFTTWLHQVVLNAARDRLRRHATQARAAQSWGEIEVLRRDEAKAASAERAWLDEALNSLPQDLRETVALVLGEDMTHGEAARVLEVGEGTVSWRMSEVRRRLKTLAGAEERTA